MKHPLPRITAKHIIVAIEKAGCTFIRQRGSHRTYRTPRGKRISVPCHAGKILHPKVVKSMLKGLQMSATELREFL